MILPPFYSAPQALEFALIEIIDQLPVLVKSWLREFDRGMQSITVPELRAKERECRLLGLERWHVPELVALLPMLLQASLVLFCVGLIVFLQGCRVERRVQGYLRCLE